MADTSNMEESKEPVGPLDGQFEYKKNKDGTVNKHIVVCSHCRKDFSFHRSTSSLKYHINAKHSFVGASTSGVLPGMRQTTLTEHRALSKTTSDKLTDTIARWIAKDCRPINIVEDTGLAEVLKVATFDAFYKPPSRGTVITKINKLYDAKKKTKEEDLASAEYVALTGDHWTSVSNNNYLGVTAHHITKIWELKSFALTVMKTEARHFAEACAQQFQTVAHKWKIEGKISTIGTDSARNMTAAAKLLPYEHMPCIAHMLQRSINVSLSDSGFANVLAKCRKIVGHFRHSAANTLELQAQQAALGQKQEPLIQDVSTRWNSTLEMIKRLNRNQAAIQETLDHQHHKLVILTPSEWDKLQRLSTLLEPCRDVTEILGGEAYISCSVVLPALCHLHQVMKVSEEDPAYVVRFKTIFMEDLASRQENINTAWLKLATALEPHFKDLKSLPKSEREEVWTSLGGMLYEQSPRRSMQTSQVGPPRKKIHLLQMGSDSESDEEVQPDRDIHRYRAEPSISMEYCPMQWWAAHSGAHDKLALLARKYLATPASMVPCERLFSVAGHIV
ncbi:E3 SUMO-protein ligase ZBED1-like [Neoarius graeffei]|uniref:E3 SUMO-protein ligase ZBED1-like n=1 Tax=Neoarius graeffei TaxID=443677 RepID=UPI00298D2E1F|nr:E3 SUMO-protein ligase ZBED1-like [Neoarius graeffei]